MKKAIELSDLYEILTDVLYENGNDGAIHYALNRVWHEARETVEERMSENATAEH